MTTATKSAAFTETDAAAILGCPVKSYRARMVALGYVKTCGRCGGSGKYSYNQTDGDRCFGCGGAGKITLPATRARAEEARRRQDAGELAGYFAKSDAIKAARAALGGLLATIDTAWQTSAIGAAYTLNSRDRRGMMHDEAHDAVAAFVAGPLFKAQGVNNAIWDHRNRIDRAVRAGAVRDLDAAVRELTDLRACQVALFEYVDAARITGWGYAVAG